MKSKKEIAAWFWILAAMALIHNAIGRSIEGSILFSATAVVGVLKSIALEYFNES